MAARSLARWLLLCSSAGALLGAAQGEELQSPDALAVDDECAAEDSSCALNALQLRGQKLSAEAVPKKGAPLEDDYEVDSLDFGCGNCMQANAPGALDDGGSINGVWHYAQNCWTPCGQTSGPCPSFCGPGNLCCRYMASDPTGACHGVTFFPVLHTHTCVSAPPGAVSTVTGIPQPMSMPHVYSPTNAALAQPSESNMLTFYMYRVMGDTYYPAENVNAANLAGVMWYLHNEVVPFTPRKFGITRIVRLKVKTRAPAPLAAKGMNFGVRFAFDSGKCTGPWICDDEFDKYGYFVGCNYVSDFPTAKWAATNKYKDAIWYSLPGPCSDKTFANHDTSCVVRNPGGACSGTPTGTGDCTFSYEPAGEIRVDELVGIQDYSTFIHSGGKEYMRAQDKGFNLDFWNQMKNEEACTQRVEKALALFKAKYGSEDLPAPPCDFNYNKFYN